MRSFRLLDDRLGGVLGLHSYHGAREVVLGLVVLDALLNVVVNVVHLDVGVSWFGVRLGFDF